MLMLFHSKDIAEIIRQHVIRVWGVPGGSIENVALYDKDRTYTDNITGEVRVKTTSGGPYREPAEKEG